jgi:hypothetical protein
MRGTAVIKGDIVGPTDRLVDWEAIKFPERMFPTTTKRKRAKKRTR